ncbi:signal recognition particle-docking protein FtsY [Adhaeretor mobilis]|uniref:Signal recognition particle receptor FtsY n=1 Tax=Adhaeretor mobilis TaxID=1930276 RepID=A0A517MXS6_9BACT|nr:signal recognition particle-docking protein FtsY [Adhaeretor mobilis]QDS99680.1 Signal recognition particle receptor FtsY [Adhaeretor mobilis]
MGIFDKFKRGLAKTKSVLKTDVRDLFKSEGRLIDDGFLDEMRALLFKTDMGYDSVEEIVAEVAKNFRGRVVTLEDVVATWKDKLSELMAQDASPISFAQNGPTVIMVAGVNGAGKTTSIAKLSKMFVDEGRKVVLGAGDTFRAAAVEQLTIWSDRLGVDIVKEPQGTHPATVAYKAVERAVETSADVCIVDTAGRLQTQKNLMAELTKIQQSIRKLIPAAPHEVLLVLDATTGQNGISQAGKFTEAVDCTGIVLAKLDGTAKGGVVVAIRQQVGLPVKYIGVGEQPEDLALFKPAEFVDALFAEVGVEPAAE